MGEAVEDKGPGWGGSACWLHFRLGLHSHGIMLLKLGGPNVFCLSSIIKTRTVQQRRAEVHGPLPWALQIARLPCFGNLCWSMGRDLLLEHI